MVGAVQHVHRVQGRTSLVVTSAAPQQLLVFVPPHPLVKHRIAVMRSSETPTPVFRSAAQELGKILLYELTRECTVQLEWSRRGGLHRCTSDTVPVAWVDVKTWGHLIKFGFKQKLKVKGKRTQQQ
jgi:uracil phosphoribosyltransferase